MTTDQTQLPSQTVLDDTPGRALTFLRGIARSQAIHAELAAAGFAPDDNEEGWKLLFKEAGYSATTGAPAATPRSPAFDAMNELDAWDEDGMRRIRAALSRLHAQQEEFVFAGGLAASTGTAAVVGVATLLDRLDALESGKGREKSTHKADTAAMATLAQRGFTKAERARLRALVDTAQTVKTPAPAPATPTSVKEHLAASVALYRWFADWSETARSVVKKRAYLITLGLAKRKSPNGKAKAPADPPKTPA